MSRTYQISGKTKILKRYAGVYDTIEAIKRIVSENHTAIYDLAKELEGNYDEETFRNIWNWVRNNIRYENDRKGKEQLRTPQRTIMDRTGDCDDMSILISSILTNLNVVHELIVAAYKSNADVYKIKSTNRTSRQVNWQHIYPVAYSREGERYVIDCVPQIPAFNYEAKPIINQIRVDMRLEELGIINSEDITNESIVELTAPFSLEGFGYMDDDEEILTIQGLLGDVVIVDEDDTYDTILSGSELKENIMIRQLIEARDSLKQEISNPTELSQMNDNRKELILVNNIIENFSDEEAREIALEDAISQNTLYKNFYKTIAIGIDDAVNGLSGEDEDDQYYLKVMDENGLFDDLDDDDFEGLGRTRKGGIRKKIRSKLDNFKKKHPKLAKVGHALKKYSPTGFAARRSLEAFLRANALQIAEKIAMGYTTEDKARKLGYSKSEWTKFVEGKNKAEQKWHSMGGKKDYFKKLIMQGRGGKKAGLRGSEELGIAPAIIAAATKVFGGIIEFFKQLKLKKSAKKEGNSVEESNVPDGMKRAGGAPGVLVDPADAAENVKTDEKSGVTEQVVTDENGNETTVYTDADGNEISKFKAMFLKNKTIIIIVACVLVGGIVGLIIWKVRQRSLRGLGEAGISDRQANFIKRQQLNNRSYAALVREEIRKDGKKINPTNRKKYYKQVFRESFQRPLSQKQISAAQRFNDLRRTVREKAKQYGGGKEGWSKAWAEVKKNRT